ncbi:hypothetical protein DFH09DRAFT_457567, partial [Mycena vulgaris]
HLLALQSIVISTLTIVAVGTIIPSDGVVKDSHSLASRSTDITYCTDLTSSGCALNSCKSYSGPPTCLNTPGTSCLIASSNIMYCTGANCAGTCQPFIPCKFPIARGFCFTPLTASILVLS